MAYFAGHTSQLHLYEDIGEISRYEYRDRKKNRIKQCTKQSIARNEKHQFNRKYSNLENLS